MGVVRLQNTAWRHQVNHSSEILKEMNDLDAPTLIRGDAVV